MVMDLKTQIYGFIILKFRILISFYLKISLFSNELIKHQETP